MENKNKPAFPQIKTGLSVGLPNGKTYSSGGLTKREYVATSILQGMCAYYGELTDEGMKSISLNAVKLTDIFLAELKNTKPQ